MVERIVIVLSVMLAIAIVIVALITWFPVWVVTGINTLRLKIVDACLEFLSFK